MLPFITQVFENLQNVNSDNMNTFYLDKDEKLTSYFINVPCICSGIGNDYNDFGQSGSTNVFTFASGVIRFADQVTVLSSEVVSTFATYTGSTVTVTASSTPPAQLYVVAVLTQTQLDAFKVQNSCTISSTAMTLAQIAAEPNPLAYLPLFAITNTGSAYIVVTDNNCAFNYGNVLLPSSQLFLTTPGTYTYTVKRGVYRLFITATAGGGGGAGGSNATNNGGGGGGSGQGIMKQLVPVVPLSTITIVVGAGGTGGGAGLNGANGNNTVFSGAFSLTLTGGNGGDAGSNPAGGASGGSIGNRGTYPLYFSGFSLIGGSGGASVFIGGASGIASIITSVDNSYLGAGGAGGTGNGSGSSTAGGNGGDGAVLIEW